MSAPPLRGVTVVSLEQAVAAPFATRQLADLGARVIKIERPGDGDFARGYDEAVHGNSSYFVWLNRSKESLTLDVKSPEGRAILGELLDRADVFVQNLSPGAAGRLGVDARALGAAHPRLIPCVVSGWGTDGPWADIAAGMYAYSGILAALLRRALTGEAGAVEVSLFDALAEWMGAPAYYTAYGGRQPARTGAEHATIVPYGPYGTADGTILLAVQNDRERRSLCTHLLGSAEVAVDPRFATNSARVAHRGELSKLISARLAGLATGEATTLLDKAGIAVARINQVPDFLAHPVLAGRDRWRTVAVPGGEILALRPPTDLAGVEPVMGAVPAVGEHTDAIMRELGRDDAAIAALRGRAVV
jgi:itaconate CoA-transferase